VFFHSLDKHRGEDGNEIRRPLNFKEQAKAMRDAQDPAVYVNNIGKIVFPIFLIVFTTLYFVLSLI
jgi:hypothetical protein